MLQTSLLLMKSLNKIETPIFLSVVCSLFPRIIFLTFILHILIIAKDIAVRLGRRFTWHVMHYFV